MAKFIPVLNTSVSNRRNLTSAECRALRKVGHSVSERCIVVSSGSEDHGIVYRPYDNGYAHASIYVQTK